MWRKLSVIALIGLLLSGYAYATDYGYPNNSVLKERSYGLLKVLNRTANFTNQLVSVSNVSVNVEETLKKAESLRIQANKLYAQGKYEESIERAKEALKLYRRIIIELLRATKEPQNKSILIRGMAMLERGMVYLERIRPMLKLAIRLYPRYSSNISELYNETLKAYKSLALDLKSGNVTAVSRDLEKIQILREKLDRVAMLLVRHQLRAESPYIATHLEVELEHHLHLLINGTNSTLALKLQRKMERIHELIKEGKYEEALALEVALSVKFHEFKKSMHDREKHCREKRNMNGSSRQDHGHEHSRPNSKRRGEKG